jgi:ParB/RepB/Spo0J family partition protein
MNDIKTNYEPNAKVQQNILNVRLGVVKNRAHTEWVSTSDVVPNPLNPRKNDAIRTDELQEILREGWEQPLTVYKKGGIYVLLSGHRRLYAARQLGVRELPVFIVEAPKTHQEEVERIAKAQLASEDWTPLEWARFTYERWLAWGRPGTASFAKSMKMPQRTVDGYVRVLDFFPIAEIESGLNQETLSISGLMDCMFWVKKVQSVHQNLVDKMTLEMIRRVMVDKMVNKKTSRESLRKRDFVEQASAQDLQRFFLDKNLHLEDLMAEYEFDVKEKTFHSHLVSMGKAKKAVKRMQPKNNEEAKKALEILKEMETALKEQFRYLENQYPDVTKESLWEWNK